MAFQSEIAVNLQSVRDRICQACARSGRDVKDVLLLAVSKTKPMEDVLAAAAAGQRAFGENYVQELVSKYEENGDLSWHMIGHLQRNKVKYIIGKVDLIHSVDSLELARQIEKEAAKRSAFVNILLEVNVAKEESKWGFDSDNVREAAKEILSMPHVCVNGVMTSAPYTDNPETNRVYFRELKRLGEDLAADGLLTRPDPESSSASGRITLTSPVLSMGMSGDFEVAVEEGATIVRVGSNIFGERDYSH